MVLKQKHIHNLALVILLLCYNVTHAQYIRHLGAYQFLGASSVYHIMRDRSGFLWFCTNHGLVKYDGNTRHSYTQQDGLPDNLVFNAYQDIDGRIWAFCYNGRYCFIDGNKVHNDTNDSMLARLPRINSYITCMVSTPDSGIYIGFFARATLHIYRDVAYWDHMASDGAGGLRITNSRIFYDTVPTPGVVVFFHGNRQLIADREGLKILTSGKETWKLNDTALAHQTVTDLCLTDAGQLVAATTHGLEIVDTKTGDRETMFKGTRITGCITDVTGNLWISTTNSGIYQLHRELNNIHRQAMAENSEWIQVNDGKLVFIKNNKLYELKATRSNVDAEVIDSNFPNYYDPLLLTNDLLVCYDNWSKSTIIRYKKKKMQQTVMNFFKRMYAYNDNSFFAYAQNNTFYCKSTNGYLNIQISTLHHSHKITSSTQDIANRNVYYISSDSLFQIDFEKKVPRFIYAFPGFLGATAIIAGKNELLISTGGHQYYSIDPASPSKSFKGHTTGFPVYGLIPMANNGMIILSEGTNYLLRSATDKPQSIVYPFSSSSYENIGLCGGNCIVRIDDQCYYFDTLLLNRHLTRSSVYIQRIIANGKIYGPGNIVIKNAVRADIQITIGLLDFNNNNNNVKYRINGPEGTGGWNIVKASQVAVVLGKEGEYNIEVAPANAPGNELPLSIHVRITPPFLRSPLFFTLCIIAAALMVVAVVLYVLRYRRLHFLRELNHLKLEHRAINALLNPHFIFNSISNIQNLIHSSQKQEAADYLATLSRLIRQNLENLKCNLIPLSDELTLIERYVRLQNLRFGGNVNLQIGYAEPDPLQVQVLPLLLHTFVENAIVHGYTEKSQLFKIDIDISWLRKDYLRIVISDNGAGIHATEDTPGIHQGSSMGISFSRRRLDRLSEFYNLRQSVEIKDLSDEGRQGTEVTILLYAELAKLFEQKQLATY